MNMQAQFHVWEMNPNASVIDIKGELTGDAESALLNAYTQADGVNAHLIILNFKNLNYLNSSGIGLLITLVVRATRQGKKLAALELPEHFKKILMLTRLTEVLPVYDSQPELEAAIQDGHFQS